VCFSFTKWRLSRAGIDDSGHNGHGAAHPDFIETRPTHVVRVVRLRIQAKALSRRAKCSAGIAVQKLQHPVVLIEAVIENRIRSSIDDIVLRVLVQFIRENWHDEPWVAGL
jgi:capsid protein